MRPGATWNGRSLGTVGCDRVLQLLLEQEPPGRRGRDGRHVRRRARGAAPTAPLARDDDPDVGSAPRPRERLRRRRRRLQLPDRRDARRACDRPARSPRGGERARVRTRRRGTASSWTASRGSRSRSRTPRHERASAHHLAVVLLPDGVDRDAIRARAARGAHPDERPLPADPSLHGLPAATRPLPVTDDVADRIFTLPLFPHMTRRGRRARGFGFARWARDQTLTDRESSPTIMQGSKRAGEELGETGWYGVGRRRVPA